MAYIGHPLVKDLLYAKAGTSFADPESENVQYPKEAEVGNAMYLCAWKVWLLQPFTGEPLEISRKMEK
jgi:23S rRNA-/tRNA-specific pseudouridylate synthase